MNSLIKKFVKKNTTLSSRVDKSGHETLQHQHFNGKKKKKLKPCY